MQKALKKLFMDSGFFFGIVIVGIIACIVEAVGGLSTESGYNAVVGINMLIVIVCLLTLFFSFKTHNKNLMKGMMGAILMEELNMAVSALSKSLEMTTTDMACAVLELILVICLFVNHFLINSDRNANPGSIYFNQYAVMLIVVVDLLWAITGADAATSGELTVMIADFVCTVCVLFSIVCVESRLDAYRLDREKAGWSEKKGYPEGYVHECEKKD